MSQTSSWAFLALAASVPAAHALTQQVLSSFIFTRYGDRTPLYSSASTSNQHVLTPYGAQQMYDAGESFRERYLRSSFDSLAASTVIQGISRYQLNPAQIDILTTDDQYTVASAQAFMQGLYPPLGDDPTLNDTYIAGLSNLANGSDIVAPLNGYQYPTITAASSYDLNSIWVDGIGNCPATTSKLLEYYSTSDFDFLNTSSWSFYQAIGEEYLQNTGFYPNSLGYAGAYEIYDYLQYEYLHNTTFRNTISDVNMTKARILAANWVDALYGNASDPVNSIAGRTLTNSILTAFSNVINMQGQTNRLNLLFGDYQPMVSFAALAGLTNEQNAAFYYIPPMSSSFVIELVALRADGDPGTDFPDSTDLFVEFYYQNGTDEDSRLTSYPLFDASPSQVLLPYSEFVSGLATFTLGGVGAWCDICGSYDIFCNAYTSGNSRLDSGRRDSGLSPAVAGVVGALVALAVAAVLFGLLMAFAGFRVHRQAGKRKSDMAGFKGSQKLASDQDLTIPKGGAAVSVAEPEAAKGHERVGSWELRQQAKEQEVGQMGAVNMNRPRRPSYEDDEIQIDPYATAVKPHDHV